MNPPKFRVWDGEKMQEVGRMTWPATGNGAPTVYAKGSTKRIKRPKLMQFVNVLDLNKQEIYEGDIVQHTERSELSGLLRAAKGGFFAIAKTKTDDRQEVWQGLFMERHCVVIGNCYQNPELMDWFQPKTRKELPE